MKESSGGLQSTVWVGRGGNQGFGSTLRRAKGPEGSSRPECAMGGGVWRARVSFAAVWSTCPSCMKQLLSPQLLRPGNRGYRSALGRLAAVLLTPRELR